MKAVLWLSVLVLLGGGFVAGLMLDGSSRLHEVVLQELIMLGLYTIGTAGALIAVAGAKAASPATANHT